jgi:hypothetical protein
MVIIRTKPASCRHNKKQENNTYLGRRHFTKSLEAIAAQKVGTQIF